MYRVIGSTTQAMQNYIPESSSTRVYPGLVRISLEINPLVCSLPEFTPTLICKP